MNSLDMEDFIRTICRDNNIADIRTKIEHSPHMMRYRHTEKTIIFNPDRCVSMANKMGLTLEIFLYYATFHEIGHYLDYSYGNQSSNVIEREQAAWSLSRELIDPEHLSDYDSFNEINLETYKRKYSNK